MQTMDDVEYEAAGEGLYPMRVVARLTGLPADTIRAWEKRYGVVRPSRTDGRARRYSEAEVRRLTALREATERGHSIGAIGRLSDEALAGLSLPAEGVTTAEPTLGHVEIANAYLTLVESFEIRRALDTITRRAALLDPREFCIHFLGPVLEEIGRRWEHGESTVLHEHIVSTHVKMVLGVYSRISSADATAPHVAFLTPEGHLHEFGINIGAILATTRNVEPIVLGPDVPNALVIDFVERTSPRALVFGVSRDFKDDEFSAFSDTVRKLLSVTEVWVGCPRSSRDLRAIEGVRYFHDFASLDTALMELGRGDTLV